MKLLATPDLNARVYYHRFDGEWMIYQIVDGKVHSLFMAGTIEECKVVTDKLDELRELHKSLTR